MPEINQIDQHLQKLATTPEYQLFCQQYGAKYTHDIAKACCYFDHKGRVQMIGYALAIRNELSQSQIKNLVGLHTAMERVFKLAAVINELPKSEDRIKSSKLISNAIEKIEYAIQNIWGFQMNSEFHRYWLQTPNCNCTSHESISKDCIFHKDKSLE